MFLRKNEIEYTILDFPITIIQVNKRRGNLNTVNLIQSTLIKNEKVLIKKCHKILNSKIWWPMCVRDCTH